MYQRLHSAAAEVPRATVGIRPPGAAKNGEYALLQARKYPQTRRLAPTRRMARRLLPSIIPLHRMTSREHPAPQLRDMTKLARHHDASGTTGLTYSGVSPADIELNNIARTVERIGPTR